MNQHTQIFLELRRHLFCGKYDATLAGYRNHSVEEGQAPHCNFCQWLEVLSFLSSCRNLGETRTYIFNPSFKKSRSGWYSTSSSSPSSQIPNSSSRSSIRVQRSGTFNRLVGNSCFVKRENSRWHFCCTGSVFFLSLVQQRLNINPPRPVP